jgi:hypothetical protein
MKRAIATTSTALVLSLSVLTGANAAQLNTAPLNSQGASIGNKPVVYGLTNTTINSSLNAPKTVVTTAGGLSAISAGTFSVPNIKATIAKGSIPIPMASHSQNGSAPLGDGL